MFTQERQHCINVLGVSAALVPPIKAVCTPLSYIEPGKWIIRIGILARLFGRTRRAVLHEFLHLLLERFPLTDDEALTFGSEDEWYADQNLWAWLTKGNQYITRYAATHPEEDFIETAIEFLRRKQFPLRYMSRKLVAKRWLERIKPE